MIAKLIATSLAALALIAGQDAAAAVVVDFDGGSAPRTFAAAGAAQTVTVGDMTIDGGVVLVSPSNLMDLPYGNTPHLYGTAYFGKQLSSTLTMSFAAGADVKQVEGVLFNGSSKAVDYEVVAWSGGQQVAVGRYSLASTHEDGWSVFRVASDAGIDKVDVRPTSNLLQWDFFIDTIAVNQSLETVLSPVPEPATALMMLAGLGLCGAWRRRARR